MGLMASVVAVGFVIVSLENVPLLLILSYALTTHAQTRHNYHALLSLNVACAFLTSDKEPDCVTGSHYHIMS